MASDSVRVAKRSRIEVPDQLVPKPRRRFIRELSSSRATYALFLLVIACWIMTPSFAAAPESSRAKATVTISSPRVDPPPSPSNQKILDELTDIKGELNNKSDSWLTAALSGLLGGLIVAGISWWTARRELSLQALEQLIAWRLKQAEEFYGPLHALLGQSKGVYEQLQNHLVIQNPKKYRFKADTFEVRDQKRWVPFRLLDEMPIIYNSNTSAGPLIDEVMRVGRRIVSTIHSHAGLALTEKTELVGVHAGLALTGKVDLVQVLANYLAHFVVLNEMYKAVKSASVPAPQLLGRYTSGYFPREFGALIEQHLMSITGDLREWELALKSLAKKKSKSA